MPAERRTETLSVKVTPTVKKQLDELAEERGQSVGELARSALAAWLRSQRIAASGEPERSTPPPAAPKALTPAPAPPASATTPPARANMAAVGAYVKKARRQFIPWRSIQQQVHEKYGILLDDQELRKLDR